MMKTPVATFTDHNVIMIETLVYISRTTFIAILGAASTQYYTIHAEDLGPFYFIGTHKE